MAYDETALKEVFTFILAGMGITSSVVKIDIEGLMDTPGHHWSNPGVKQVSVYTSGNYYYFVLKTLGQHSKREIHVYRHLSALDKFPVPRLYHAVYDDEKREYWMVIEHCVSRNFPEPAGFWKECGILLARIHAAFWGKTDTLPDFFQPESDNERYRNSFRNLVTFLDTLNGQDTILFERELDISIIVMHSALDNMDIPRIPDSPVVQQCLLHGSFHSPEIMWRETSSGYLPLGVDWEGSRAGIPAEDLAFACNNLLAKDEYTLYDLFLDTYLTELGRHGITPDRNEISASIRQEACAKQAGSVIPFLLKTYLDVRSEESYADWCRWLKQEIPSIFRFIRSEVENGRVYGG